MRTKFLSAIICAVMCVGFTSCEYDDEALWKKTNELDTRIKALEEVCEQMNGNISALQTLVNALNNGYVVTSVTPFVSNNEELGYIITFSNNTSIIIYHGKNGTNGTNGSDGADGTNGKDGTDGADGQTPIIGVKLDTDGVYYWTLNGDWLLDENGNKVKAQGNDGKDGADGTNGQDGVDGVNGTNGQNGQDGITPQLKIEDGFWYVSTDNGATWTQLGKATGDKGEQGDSMLQSITQDDENVYFTLADGTIITIAKQTGGSSGTLTVSFSQQKDIEINLGGTVTIDYTITGGGESPIIKLFDSESIIDDGWTIMLSKTTASTGTITVTCSDMPVVFAFTLIVSNGSGLASMYEFTFTIAERKAYSSDTKEAVDLGLPSGTLWATCNVGASSPEEYGDYFAWGETFTKSTYDLITYKYCKGSNTTITKYCIRSDYGTVDNKTVLDPEDDAAIQNWGGSWRMPTYEEQTELRNNCTWTWTSKNGVNGYVVKGTNGNSIFLPAAGERYKSSLNYAGAHGYYLSSLINTSDSYYRVYALYLWSGDYQLSNFYRYEGYSVRAVCKK